MVDLSHLPAPITDKWDWQQEGACRVQDSRLFFHPEGGRGPARRNRDTAALAVCATCPVIRPCRAHGLAFREPYGIWGGLTEHEREDIHRSVLAGQPIVQTLLPSEPGPKQNNDQGTSPPVAVGDRRLFAVKPG